MCFLLKLFRLLRDTGTAVPPSVTAALFILIHTLKPVREGGENEEREEGRRGEDEEGGRGGGRGGEEKTKRGRREKEKRGESR